MERSGSTARHTRPRQSGGAGAARAPRRLAPMDVRDEMVTIHGHRHALTRAGRGPVLVLLHGVGSTRRTFDRVLGPLAEQFTVIAPDLLGHGESDKPRGDYSLGGYANGVRDLLDALGVPRATLVGHSYGGGVALQFAYQFPQRTQRLVLVASGGLGTEVSPVLRALTLPGAGHLLALGHRLPLRDQAQRLAARLGSVVPGLAGALVADAAEMGTVFDALADPATRSAVLQLLRHVVDWRGQSVTMRDRAYLAEEMPTLVIWGGSDHLIPAHHAAVARLALPHSRVVLLPGVGHFPHRERPAVVATEIAEFVHRVPASSWDSARWQAHLLTGGALPG